MSFPAFENSIQDSLPDELYDFEYLGDNSHYRVTSSAFQISFDDGGGAENYLPIAIKRNQVQSGAEPTKNNLTLTVQKTNTYFRRFIIGTLTYDTTLSLYTLQPDGSYQITWSGSIVSVEQKSNNINVTLSPVSNEANKPMMHRKFQRQCPHALYSYYCTVSEGSFTHAGTLDAVNGNVLTSTTFGAQVDGYFTSGRIQIGSEIKTIVKHVGDDITLLDSFYDISASDPFTAYAGCDHTIETCETKFSNEENFGGFPWIPSDDNIQTGRGFTY